MRFLVVFGACLGAAYGQAPALELSVPVNESVYRTGSDITLAARCSVGITRVRFLVDGQEIGQAACDGSAVWKAAASGIHTLSVSAGAVTNEPSLIFVNDAAAKPRAESLQGIVQAVVEDRFEQRTSNLYYSILVNGTRVPVAAPTAAVRAAVQSGKPVTLEGFREGGRFYPRATGAVEAENTAAPLAAFGTRRVAVILINYLNQTSQPVTQAQAASVMSTISQFYQEASYGQFSVAADIYGYLSLPINESCDLLGDTTSSAGNFVTITSAGIQAAQNAGIDLSPYQSYVFIGPTATQCGGGVATIGGSPALALIRFNSDFPGFALSQEIPIAAHELGHHLGLYHSHSYACTIAIYNPNVDCGLIEYGDLDDIMGSASFNSSLAHFNACYKDILGWLSPRIPSVSGIYELAPFESPRSSALKLTPPSGSDLYYFEFRQPIGFDSTIFNTQVFDGALLHLGGNSSFILNMHPEDVKGYGPPKPALAPGETYTDYANRFSVTTLSVTPAALTVQILLPGVTTPTALITNPAAGSNVGGTTQVAVAALDRAGITKVELYADGTLIGTQNGLPSQADSAGPAQYYTFSWNTAGSWNTTGAATGSHTLTAKAYNASGASYATSITVNVHRPPTVSLLTAVNGQLSAQAAASETGASITQVEFFVNGSSVGLGQLANGVYSLSWSASKPGAYTVTATATDTNGLTATTPAATVTVAAPTIASVNVVDGVSAIAQNAWIEIYGSNLAPGTVSPAGLTWAGAPDFASGRMPAQLDGVSVMVNGKPAFVYFISQGQIDVLTPLDGATGPVQIAVTNGTISSAGFSINLQAEAPAFALAGATKYVAATHADGSYVITASPAQPGETVVLYGFGFGLPASPLTNGSTTQTGTLPAPPVIQIGEQTAQVVFAGLISPGVYQFNIVIPATAASGDDAVAAIYYGFSTPVGALVPVEPAP